MIKKRHIRIILVLSTFLLVISTVTAVPNYQSKSIMKISDKKQERSTLPQYVYKVMADENDKDFEKLLDVFNGNPSFQSLFFELILLIIALIKYIVALLKFAFKEMINAFVEVVNLFLVALQATINCIYDFIIYIFEFFRDRFPEAMVDLNNYFKDGGY